MNTNLSFSPTTTHPHPVGVPQVTAPRWTASTAPDNGHHALWVSKCGVTLFEK